jgi:hypothetical protein
VSNAREKLGEAKYFLDRMRESQPDGTAFKYNLSAFLSAARSVRNFLRAEYENVPGFMQWWESKRAWVGIKKGRETASYEEVLRKISKISDPVQAANAFFDETRNVTIHQRSVEPRAHVNVELSAPLRLGATLTAVIVRAEGTTEERPNLGETEPPAAVPETAESEPTVEWRWYFLDLPPAAEEKDVVALSEEHVARLERLVSEAESVLPSS